MNRFIALSLGMLLVPFMTIAQEHYRFNCKDYVSTDNSRAPQSAFTYDTEQNRFSISATGANNVAFQMNTGMDGEYFIDSDETLLMICGTNLSTASNASYVWWLNGFNQGGQTPPDKIQKDGDQTVLLWNLKTNSGVNRNFDFTKERIPISANGGNLIMAAGMTALSGSEPGTITDLGYYAPFEVAAKHPVLMTYLRFSAKTLTTAIKDIWLSEILSLDIRSCLSLLWTRFHVIQGCLRE